MVTPRKNERATQGIGRRRFPPERKQEGETPYTRRGVIRGGSPTLLRKKEKEFVSEGTFRSAGRTSGPGSDSRDGGAVRVL
jgi:hypothetical protein